jgi:hypothetical protein
MGLASIISLLFLPAGIFIIYSLFTGARALNFEYVWGNYLWCSAVLYVGIAVLMLVRVSRAIQIQALAWGNAALVGFCLWMASLMARGYVDLAIAWILLFPIQLVAMIIGSLIQHKFRHKTTVQ